MSLKRKFKFERAPLIDNDEVRRSKKFGFMGSKQPAESAKTSQRSVSKVRERGPYKMYISSIYFVL